MGCCRSRDVGLTQKEHSDDAPCMIFEGQVISGELSDSPNNLAAAPADASHSPEADDQKDKPQSSRDAEEVPDTTTAETEKPGPPYDLKSDQTTADQCLSDSKESDDQESVSLRLDEVPAPKSPIAVVVPVTALSGFIRETEFAEEEIRTLEAYVLSLQESDKWKDIDQPQEGVVGKKLPKTKFSSEVPAFYFAVEFPEPVPAELILGLLDEPDWRTEWDQRAGQMNRIRIEEGDYFLQYILLKCNAPLNHRDFLCKYCVRKVANETRVLQKSMTHRVLLTQEFPVTKGVERAKTYFCLYRIFESEGSTQLQVSVQVNMFFSIKRLQDVMPMFLVRWFGRFRELALSRYHDLLSKDQP